MAVLLLGAIAMACFTIGLFFIRFWKSTRDRFFLFFAASFFIQGVERSVMGLLKPTSEQEPLFYCIRLVAFLVLLYAIIDKNRASQSKDGGNSL